MGRCRSRLCRQQAVSFGDLNDAGNRGRRPARAAAWRVEAQRGETIGRVLQRCAGIVAFLYSCDSAGALFRNATFAVESAAISFSLRRSALASSCLTDERCQRVPPRGVRSRMASSWAAICCNVQSDEAVLMPTTKRTSRSPPPCGGARNARMNHTADFRGGDPLVPRLRPEARTPKLLPVLPKKTRVYPPTRRAAHLQEAHCVRPEGQTQVPPMRLSTLVQAAEPAKIPAFRW